MTDEETYELRCRIYNAVGDALLDGNRATTISNVTEAVMAVIQPKPEVPPIVEEMAKAMSRATEEMLETHRGKLMDAPDVAQIEARAALQVVVRRLSIPLPPKAIANYAGLPENYVMELL